MLRQMDAVCQHRRHIQKTQTLHVFRRGHPVLPHATVEFKLSLRQMHVDAKSPVRGDLRDISQIILAAGIDRVRPQGEAHMGLRHAIRVIHLIEGFLQPAQSAFIPAVRADKSPGDKRPYPAVRACSDTHLRKHMHVDETGRAGTEHLHDGKHVPPVALLRRHFALQRIDLLEQPLLKRQVVGVIAKNRHIRVCMGVDQSGHAKPVRSVDRHLRSETLRLLVDPRDTAARNIQVSSRSRLIFEEPDIPDQ